MERKRTDKLELEADELLFKIERMIQEDYPFDKIRAHDRKLQLVVQLA
jgi:hypothetical protein